MNFTCNQAKNDSNILNRGLPLLAAQVMFTPAMLVREDVRKAYPERRFVGYNTIEGRLMVVVFCMPSDNHIHIISFRKANDRELKNFKAQTL
ncbi:MAG: BrnT family toxin [Pseudomonadota bacterium]